MHLNLRISIGQPSVICNRKKLKRMKIMFRDIFLVLLFLYSANLYSADIRIHKDSAGYIVGTMIEGAIKKGDYEKFKKVVVEYGYDAGDVYILSSGGDVIESIKIGTLIRKLNFTTNVPMRRDDTNKSHCSLSVKPKDKKNCTCMSSCFLIYVSGVDRYGNYIGIHRPRMGSDGVKRLANSEYTKIYNNTSSLIKDYFNNMGVPSYVYDIMMSVKSTNVELLDSQIIEKYLDGYIPSVEEKLISKCGELTKEEQQEFTKLLLLKRNNRSFDADKNLKYDSLSAKKDDIFDCQSNELRKMQIQSFNDFAMSL